MTLLAVVGDGATTTALGLAVALQREAPCVVVEFDPAGGCLSAWLDLRRSPGLAEVTASSGPCSCDSLAAVVQHATCGLDVVVAPVRALEAAAVIHAAAASVLPVLSALDEPIVVADGGRLRGGLTPLVRQAGVVVVAHRQHRG